MPRNNTNNAKVLSSSMLRKFKEKYIVTYVPDDDTIRVTCTDCARLTVHNASDGFSINAKKFHRKISFGKKSIETWKELLQDEQTKDVTIFDVHNALVILKAMYQKPTKERIVEIAKHGYNGVKRPNNLY